MLSSQAILILYAPGWDTPSRLSKHHLAHYWARHNRVLWVETPPNPLTFLKRPSYAAQRLRLWLSGPQQVEENLWVHTFFYPALYHGVSPLTNSLRLNALNQAVIRPQLQRDLRRLNMERPLIIVGLPQAVDCLRGIPRRLLIYHCADEFTRVAVFPPSLADLERRLLAETDLVIATAEPLRAAKALYNSRTFCVRNGANADHFARVQSPETPIAAEIRDLPRPIVGYVGSVFEWIDQEMIAFAARERPDWSFVFVGPLTTDVTVLRSRPNIHILGPRPYADLPQYLKGFDVATVPFAYHEVTLKASPIKFYEYLASGVPVVAIRIPDFEEFDGLVELFANWDEFMAALDQAVTHDTPEAQSARMAEARKHSWETRFAKIDSLIEDALRMRTSVS